MAYSEIPSIPFVLLTERLIIVPTPLAVDVVPYIDLYRAIHANSDFCWMGFGPGFTPKTWTRDECGAFVRQGDIGRGWLVTGMGDFAVGLRGEASFEGRLGGDMGRAVGEGIQIVEGDEYQGVFGSGTDGFDGVEWVGYAGVRHAIKSMPDREPGDPPLPPMEELVELRYGVAPEYWGKGIARGGADAVMGWAVEERGVRRFVAETEKANGRSNRVLEKMGFKMCDTNYWKNDDEWEWERIV